LFHRVLFAVLALAVFDPRFASADSFNDAYFRVDMSYHTGEPDYVGEILREDTALLSREERLEHADVLATGGFVANANGTLLRAAAEVGASVYIDYDAGVYWNAVTVQGTSFATTSDVLTIEGPLGATGAIRFWYAAEGTLYQQLEHGPGTTGGGYVVDEMISNGHLTFSVQGQDSQTPFNESFEPTSDEINPALPRQTEDVNQGLTSTGDFLFPFNTPFRITYELVASVSITATNLDAGEFVWLGGAGFENTAQILGVALFDDAGQPIPNATIHSSSGLLYPVVPEPSTLALLALGAVGLSACARAQRPPA
jgi:hypothetical protein